MRPARPRSFRFGQWNIFELDAARRVAAVYNVESHVLANSDEHQHLVERVLAQGAQSGWFT